MGTFQNSLKKCFFTKNTQAASPNGRIALLDANGENAGSSPLTTMAMMLARDVFYIDDNIDTPSQKITGTVNGMVLQYIRRNSHRYLVKKTGEGTAAICQLKDDDSTKYADGTTAVLDGTQGDVMVKLPEFYYKCVETSTTHKWKVTLALRDPSGTMEHWDGTQLIGAYEGYVTGNKLYSRSGVESTIATHQSMKNFATARGTGYTLMKWQQHNILGMLFYAMYGTTDSQGVIGSGTDSSTKATGQTNSIGMADTVQKNDGSINFWGLENAWGNKAEWIDNVTVDYNANGNQFKVTEDDGTVRTVVSKVGQNNAGFVTKMVLGSKFDLVSANDDVVGSDTTGYCDGFYASTSSSLKVDVSYRNNLGLGGVSYARGLYKTTDSVSSAIVTARLAFKGTLTRYTDVNAFKQL